MAVKLASAGFIIPYIFVYSPGLLLIDTSWGEILLIIVSAVIGIFALSFAGSGYWNRNLHLLERTALLLGAVLLIFPGWESDLPGLCVLGVIYYTQKLCPGEVSREKID